ncbi:CAP domain-containing protein [Oceanimonas marisflavi]|uniref:CAP domain-containing protein n=1 Tax=Oceanimonas marisflavi TaxID=2059724 RepID=UPI000D317445|nr:CAP domain-containing protein [Oceanimonas marisflavi]
MKIHYAVWLTGLLAGTAAAGDMKQALLDAHNSARAEVGAGPLLWSVRAEQQAASWARVLSRRCDIEHSQGSGFGENLFMGTRGYYDELDGVKSWEDEKRYYSGQPLSRALVPKVGHYTQMVWPDTRELGCATSTCNDIMILVCNYYPPGNYLGESAW